MQRQQLYDVARAEGATMTVEYGATAVLIFNISEPDAIGCDIFPGSMAVAIVSRCGAIIRSMRNLTGEPTNAAAFASLDIQLNNMVGYLREYPNLFTDIDRVLVAVVQMGVHQDMPDFLGWIRSRFAAEGIKNPILHYELPVLQSTAVKASLFADCRTGFPWLYIEGTPHRFMLYLGH